MKVCFIGLGSIGKRHLNNLVKVAEQREINLTINALRHSQSTIYNNVDALIEETFLSFEALPDDYDIIFITNPTSLHADTLSGVSKKSKHFFIEKPVFDKNIADYEHHVFTTDQVIYIACPLRHTTVYKYLKETINSSEIFSVRAMCSSYLPEWRKSVDYRNIYSSHKDQGGGVSLDLIHEWDYLIDLFGFPKELINITGKFSSLEIDSDDLSIYVGKYSNKIIELHLDYFGRTPRREIELYSDNYTIHADFIKSIINFFPDTEKGIRLEKEDSYINEMNYFLDIIQKKYKNLNSISHAMKVLNITLGLLNNE